MFSLWEIARYKDVQTFQYFLFLRLRGPLVDFIMSPCWLYKVVSK